MSQQIQSQQPQQQTQTDNKTLTMSSSGQPTTKTPKGKPGENPNAGIPVGSTGKLYRFDS